MCTGKLVILPCIKNHSYMLTFLIFYFPSVVFVGSCKASQFRCDTSPQCLQIFSVCDGINDCEDASDEEPNMCGRLEEGWVLLSARPKLEQELGKLKVITINT